MRALAKTDRQRLIESIVTRKRVGTQLELLDALAAAGCSVTQATISRDIRELGLEKGHDQLGRPRYTLSGGPRGGDPRDALASVLAQFGSRAVHAGNIVVVVSELGTAPAIARSLDQLEHPQVVGTLAGDDTTLVVAPSPSAAGSLARELNELIGR